MNVSLKEFLKRYFKDRERSLFGDGSEVFQFVFLSGLYGLLFLILFFRLNVHELAFKFTLHEAKLTVFKTYALGWIVFPVLGVVAAALLKMWRENSSFEKRPFFYPIFIAWNVFFAAFLFNPRPSWFFHGSEFVLFFLMAQIAAFYSTVFVQKNRWTLAGTQRFVQGFCLLLAGVWTLGVHWHHFLLSAWDLKNYLSFGVIILAFHFLVPRPTVKEVEGSIGGNVGRVMAYIAVFSLILFSVFDTNFKYLEGHYVYYLGPIADMQAGKSLLNNIDAQYGVLVFYFLEWCFRLLPLGFKSFSFLDTVFQTAQFFLLYFIVRQLFSGELFRLFVTLMVVLVVNFAQGDWFSYYPSAGALRFGFVYILMALVLLRRKYPNVKETVLLVESLVVAAAFFWGFDVFIYTVPAYISLIFYESIVIDGRIGFDGRRLTKRAFSLAMCIVVIGGFIYGDIFLKTHEVPHWRYYFDYVFLYEGGFSMIGLHVEDGYWLLVLGIFYFSIFSIFAIGLKRHLDSKSIPEEMGALFFLTMYGIFQFFYYLGRSHPDNLCRISMPGTLLAIYWIYYVRRFAPRAIPESYKKIGFSFVVIVAALFVQPFIPVAAQKLEEQIAPVPVLVERTIMASHDRPREDAYALRVANLMTRYSGNNEHLVYFLGDQDLRVAMYTRKYNVYPYNDWEQAEICSSACQRALAFDPHLAPGDYIYYDMGQIKGTRSSGSTGSDYLEAQLVSQVEKSYRLKVVEKDHGFVVAEVRGSKGK